MKKSSILISLSLRIPLRLSAASSAVVPLPIRSSFDQQLTAELEALQSSAPASSSSSSSSSSDDDQSHYTWILQVLEASTTAQQITLTSLASKVFRDSDRSIIDQYLDSNVRMLDTCNELTERIEIIHNYVESLKVVSHLLEDNAEPHPAALARVVETSDSCKAMERRRNEMGKGDLKKMVIQKQDSR